MLYDCIVFSQCVQGLKTKGLFIPFHYLTLNDNLGSGAFGIVKKAELFETGSHGTFSTVAVKMLKGESIITSQIVLQFCTCIAMFHDYIGLICTFKIADSASSEDERDIIMELKALYHVGKHPNIVSFLGASMHNGKQH